MFVDRFFEMEKKCNFFELKSEEGFPVWDILRFSIYQKYTFPPVSHIGRNKLSLSFIYSVGLLRVFFSLFSFCFKKAPVIFFTYGRNIDENGKLFDKCCENIIRQTDRYLIVERFRALKKYRYPIEYNFVQFYKNFSREKVKISDEIANKIIEALAESFGESKVTKDELDRIYTDFMKGYAYYRFFFRLKRPEKVYFIGNGLQKGMVAAAHSLGIQIEEIQHGMFERDHLAYSYPSFIQKHDKAVIFPDVFYTMGALWGAGVNIPTLIIPVGNDYFANTSCNESPDGSILFISSIIHEADLSELAIDFVQKNPSISINFKLHPNEFRDEKKYIKRFAAYSNIHLLRNEIALPVLIAKAKIVVLINSTVLYETLNQGGKVAIYKKVNYESQVGCFNHPNVYLLDGIDDLEKAYDAPKKDIKEAFFDKFDVEKFKSYAKSPYYRA